MLRQIIVCALKRVAIIVPILLLYFTAFSQDSSNCVNKTLGVVHFTTNKAILTKASKIFLDSVFTQINLHPACKISVKSYLLSANYSSQQEAWDRAYIVIWYLKKKGVDEKRFLFSYDEPGTQRITNIHFTDEDGPFIEAPPVRNLSTLKNISWKEVQRSGELQWKNQ